MFELWDPSLIEYLINEYLIWTLKDFRWTTSRMSMSTGKDAYVVAPSNSRINNLFGASHRALFRFQERHLEFSNSASIPPGFIK